MKKETPRKIIVSRTDSIGDVLLTVPLCKWIKEKYPQTKLIFLCKNYTAPVLEQFSVIDQVLSVSELLEMPFEKQVRFFKKINADWILHVFPNKEIAELAKKAKIKNRVGTSHRFFHFFTCNIRVSFTRKKSILHESQLNFNLAIPLGLKEIPSFESLRDLSPIIKPSFMDLPKKLQLFIDNKRFVVLHPKSQGSALEWPLNKYIQLCNALISNGFFVVFTGTQKEGDLFRSDIPRSSSVFDSTGHLNLGQLMSLISKSNSLVACSTGPLHLGGVLGVKSIGLFSSRKPIHPGRWKPLGSKSTTIVFDNECLPCKKGKSCACIENISVDRVLEKLIN